MSMLTSAFAYLGSYYGEANPSLQGELEDLEYSLILVTFYRARFVYQSCQG